MSEVIDSPRGAVKADFSQSRNDMHWKVWAGADKFIRWGGYDDAYWWDHVSKSENARRRVGSATGRVFTIDFDTNEVTVEAFDGAQTGA